MDSGGRLLIQSLLTLQIQIGREVYAQAHPNSPARDYLKILIELSTSWTFDALLITFIGGVGTLIGPVLGAVFYVFVRERLAVMVVNLHPIIFGTLFILIVLVFPGGLVDIWTRLRRLVRRRGNSTHPR